ncbi:MAG: hypothetical protein H6773_04235 [Pseudomonadales bacterium]|nr:hypothetical protein [Pseudomonadales bacterium]
MNDFSKNAPPSADVLKAFGISDEAILLPGGEGTSYRAGDIVLKPTQNNAESAWIATTLSSINQDGFRVTQQVKTTTGEWVSDGWQAFRYLKGKYIKGRWEEKIDISRKFHGALSTIEKPNFIGTRQTPWEVADSEIWGSNQITFDQQLQKVTNPLLAVKQDIFPTEQLIHGDITGNILFSESLSPAIIDFSPYWRPAEYATAILIVDALVWEGAADSLFSKLENTWVNNQLLIRAALWRIKTSELFSQRKLKDLKNEASAYAHFVDVLLKRISHERK